MIFRGPLNKLDVPTFCEFYLDRRMSLFEIAHHLGVPKSSLFRWVCIKRPRIIDAVGFETFSDRWKLEQERKRVPGKPRGSLGKLTVEEFSERYFAKQQSLDEIGNTYGASRQGVFKWFQRHSEYFDSPLRDVGKPMQLGKNTNFFKTWNPEMAYVLGLLVTDGNVSNSSWAVTLTSTDEELPEKIRDLMDAEVEIRKIQPRGWSKKVQYQIQISSKEIVNDLFLLGVGPKKSRTVDFPLVPDEILRHFIRGCWDGDGSLYVDGKGKLVAKIVSGSKTFLQGMSLRLKRIGFARKRPGRSRANVALDPMSTPVYEHIRMGGKPSYDLSLSGKSAIEFCKWMYDGIQESAYLVRKYAAYKSASEDLKFRNSKSANHN